MRSSGLAEILPDGKRIPAQAYDLWNLYSTVTRKRPGVVLEFGVGYSTIVMAEALHRIGSGRLVTVDAAPEWIEATAAIMPEHLRPIVTLHHSTVAATTHAGQDCHAYTDVPDITPDLIYLDGPDPKDVNGWPAGMKPIAADILHIEPRLTKGAEIIVDTRLENVAFLRHQLKRAYRFSHHDIFRVSRFELIG